jgi:hypothetical protein
MDSNNPQDRAAILPSRLAWLCQPEQIEYTLYLLFCLQFWKINNHQVLSADRQGLQEVQALVLEEAYRRGAVQAVTYLDESQRFPGDLLLESAADSAARGVLIHLKNLSDPEFWPPFVPEGSGVYQQFIRPLYKHITGQDFPRVADALNALEQEQIHAYIQAHLQRLVERSKTTRRPIPLRRLARLCIAPVDLLPIRENRLYFLDGFDTWKDLDISDRRKLDPEGGSAIAFRYAGPTAEYVFHLPYRRAEIFLSDELLRSLWQRPGTSLERGIFQGQVIDETEGLKHPAKEILQDLGVDIVSVCPHELVDKQTYLARPAVRDLLWPTTKSDPQAWADDPWDSLVLPPEERL